MSKAVLLRAAKKAAMGKISLRGREQKEAFAPFARIALTLGAAAVKAVGRTPIGSRVIKKVTGRVIVPSRAGAIVQGTALLGSGLLLEDAASGLIRSGASQLKQQLQLDQGLTATKALAPITQKPIVPARRHPEMGNGSRTGQPIQLLPLGGQIPEPHQVVRQWDTAPGPGVTGGGLYPIFNLLADGHIWVQKLDGAVKHYRPYRPLVIGKNPSISKLARVERRIERAAKSFRKHLRRHK
jgi:hypothetical protein